MAYPDPNLSKARFVPPKGACDIHCHVFGKGTPSPELDAERLFALHRHFGFDHAVIVEANENARDVTVEALAASGSRYRGIARIKEATSDKELEALHAVGVRGVRFTFVSHLGGAPDLTFVRRVLDQIRPLGWHVTFLIDPPDLLINLGLMQAIRTNFVIDHMGRGQTADGLDAPGFKALVELMKRDNAWVKVSGPDRISSKGPPFADAVPFAQALIAAAPDRVLWGTDWPHPTNKWQPNDSELVDLIPVIAPDAATRQKLLVDNPARLYGFTD
ncbi:MAG TPA: amidohydrolase family protein [Stellaceae bacterium]|nr:amidohydrolase family protein [Stellaceae bacterium]